MNRLQTDFLVPRMSWLTGAGTIWNLAGRYYCYNVSATEEEADSRALYSDWSMIGQDLRNAIRQTGSSFAQQLELELDK